MKLSIFGTPVSPMSPADFYLVRGLAREAAHWGSFTSDLQRQDYCHSVTALDLPGTGRYFKLSAPLTIAENAEFLLSMIEDSERPKALVAISLGGMVAVEMLQRSYKVFQQAFIINASFSNLSPVQHRLQLQAYKQFYHILKEKDHVGREREVLKMVSQRPDLWPDLAQQWAEVAQIRPISIKNFVRQLLAAATYKIKSRRYLTPVLAINSAGDQMVSPECSEKFADFWNIPLVTHPSAGHDLSVDDGEWLLKIIGEHFHGAGAQTGPSTHSGSVE